MNCTSDFPVTGENYFQSSCHNYLLKGTEQASLNALKEVPLTCYPKKISIDMTT